MEDIELRQILARDYAELKKLLKVGAHKSAIVLSGSIMEALLVAALHPDLAAAQVQYAIEFPKRSEKPLDRWELHELIAVAARRELVGDNLKAEAAVVQDYRNLIHPMAEQRKNAVIDANAVNAVVSLLVRILNYLSVADDAAQDTEVERFLHRLRRTRGEAEAQVAGFILDWAQRAAGLTGALDSSAKLPASYERSRTVGCSNCHPPIRSSECALRGAQTHQDTISVS